MNNDILLRFSEMKAPKINRTKGHPLNDILFIAVAAILSGAKSWNDIADYGKSKIEWLGSILELPIRNSFTRYFQ